MCGPRGTLELQTTFLRPYPATGAQWMKQSTAALREGRARGAPRAMEAAPPVPVPAPQPRCRALPGGPAISLQPRDPSGPPCHCRPTERTEGARHTEARLGSQGPSSVHGLGAAGSRRAWLPGALKAADRSFPVRGSGDTGLQRGRGSAPRRRKRPNGAVPCGSSAPETRGGRRGSLEGCSPSPPPAGGRSRLGCPVSWWLQTCGRSADPQASP